MATRREVIRFDAEPIKVTLDKGPHAGIECRGQYGIDWRYSVNHGKSVMYLPAEGREALLQSGAAAGEEVAIRRLGKTRWEAERIAPDLPFPSQPDARQAEETDQPGTPTFGSTSITGTAVRTSRTAGCFRTVILTRTRSTAGRCREGGFAAGCAAY